MEYHRPVLLSESIEGLRIKEGGLYVDVTFGGGGHSKEILKQLVNGSLIAFDQDEDAKQNLISDNRFVFVPKNFSELKSGLKSVGVAGVDGVLADLGVSSHQFDEAERGFSIRFDAGLDMRMNQNEDLTAEMVLNTYDEKKLARVFREFGEVDKPGKMAWMICEARKVSPIKTIEQLKNVIVPMLRRDRENKELAKVFQALRIEVNNEIEVLKEMLQQSIEVLKPGGRLVVISYHSLEDRLVKNFMRSGNFEGVVEKDFYGNPLTPFRLITGKPIIPTEEEIRNNNRARSAKLRIAEKRI